MSNDKPGMCRRCDRTEQVCARDAGCCEACTHWDYLDANGNDKAPRDAEHGTDRGYQQHRVRLEAPCQRCKNAHNAYQSSRLAADIKPGVWKPFGEPADSAGRWSA